jgi:hypothetical protein
MTDVYGMTTDKQFSNTVEDNIRERGASTKLISDRAQVEISKKVQAILRTLFVGVWQRSSRKTTSIPKRLSFPVSLFGRKGSDNFHTSLSRPDLDPGYTHRFCEYTALGTRHCLRHVQSESVSRSDMSHKSRLTNLGFLPRRTRGAKFKWPDGRQCASANRGRSTIRVACSLSSCGPLVGESTKRVQILRDPVLEFDSNRFVSFRLNLRLIF